jgi:small subunit ribosomal protein S18
MSAGPTGGGARPPGPRGDRPERGGSDRGDRPERGGSDRGDRPERGGFDRGDRPERGGFDRGDRYERRERGPMSTKARLRAKARKKARKAQKKRGGFLRKKVCRFCADAKIAIDYKDAKGLRYFVTETGKMIPQRISGNCARHQRAVATAVKRARQLALMPYSSLHGG